MSREKYDELEAQILSKAKAVQIKIDNRFAGSGVAFEGEHNNYRYVFTVFHVINNWIKGTGKIQFIFQDGIIELQEGDKIDDKICFAMTADDVEKYSSEINKIPVEKDVVVIKLEKLPHMKSLGGFSCLNIDLIREDVFYIGNGYSDESHVAIELFGRYKTFENNYFICREENNSNFYFSDAMIGHSGTGIFIENSNVSILLGLVDRCKEEELHNLFSVTGIYDLITEMKSRGWDAPETIESANINKDNICDGKYEKVREKYIGDLILAKAIRAKYRMFCRQISADDILQNEMYYDVPICSCRSRGECVDFIVGRIFLLGLYQLINKDYKNQYYENNKNIKVKLEYICSEGKGEADIGTVVSNMIDNKVLGKEIKGNSIVIWQSKASTSTMRQYSNKNLKRIVENIVEDGDEKKSKPGLDLLDGEMKEKGYAIIHLSGFGEKINKCNTIDDLECAVREVLDEIWE